MIINGSFGEGGGSIVRFAIAFATLLNKPIKIQNIRANRKIPGLKSQHLTGIQLLSKITKGTFENATLGSKQLLYKPNTTRIVYDRKITGYIPTAGSLGLVFQALNLSTANINKTINIEITGGATYGLWAPSLDYIKHVSLPALRLLGFNGDISIKKHGFYPKGGAKVYFDLIPPISTKKAFEFKQTPISKVTIISRASRKLQKSKVAERQVKGARKVFLDSQINNVEISALVSYESTLSTGSGITIYSNSHPFGASNVGRPKKRAELVGMDCAEKFISDYSSGSSVDEFLADQLIPYMGLVPGSCILIKNPSNHTKTNIWLTEQFLNINFKVQLLKDKLSLIISEKKS